MSQVLTYTWNGFDKHWQENKAQEDSDGHPPNIQGKPLDIFAQNIINYPKKTRPESMAEALYISNRRISCYRS